MRTNFHFVHRVQPDLMYHAVLVKDYYVVSWEKNEHSGADSTTFSVESAEKNIDEGAWIIQIV